MHDEASYFRSADGLWLRLFGNSLDAYASADGLRFHKAHVTRFTGTKLDHRANLDYGDGRTATYSLAGGTAAEVDGIPYLPHPAPADPELVPLPVRRVPMRAAVAADGTMVCLTFDKYAYYPVRMFVGDPAGAMRQVEITNIELYRDGGTVVAETAMGTLNLPVEGSSRSKPRTLGGMSLTRQDIQGLEVAEDGDTMTVIRLTAPPCADRMYESDRLTSMLVGPSGLHVGASWGDFSATVLSLMSVS